MTDAAAPGAPARDMSLPTRFVGMILSPREAYQAVVARPRALGMLLLTIALSAGVIYWLYSTEAGQRAYIDTATQQLQALESLGMQLPDQAFDNIEQSVGSLRYWNALSVAVMTPIVVLILAAILMGVFNSILGGDARFKQVFAVVTHAGVIWTLAGAFNAFMGVVAGRLTGAASLAVFLPMIEETGFIGRLLGYVDVFWLWGFGNLAIGLAVLYRRAAAPIAITFISLYLAFGVLYAAIRAAFGG